MAHSSAQRASEGRMPAGRGGTIAMVPQASKDLDFKDHEDIPDILLPPHPPLFYTHGQLSGTADILDRMSGFLI